MFRLPHRVPLLICPLNALSAAAYALERCRRDHRRTIQRDFRNRAKGSLFGISRIECSSVSRRAVIDSRDRVGYPGLRRNAWRCGHYFGTDGDSPCLLFLLLLSCTVVLTRTG